jgi:hypothetical protein
VQYAIWGWAAVFDPDGQEVQDLTILRQLAGFVDEEDRLHWRNAGGG